VDRQRQQRLRGVQGIVIADHSNGDGAEAVIHGKAAVTAGRVSGNIADADGIIISAVGEVNQCRRRNQNAPAAIALNQTGVLTAVQRDGDHLPGLHIAGRPGHQLGQALFRPVENIVTGKRADGDLRQGTTAGNHR